jgi:anti-sigma-K factor RskA
VNVEEIRELAAVYALGGLDGEDRARFEALLAAGDPEARAALRDFEGTLVQMAATAAETPPPRVKAALMERIRTETRPAPVRMPIGPVPVERPAPRRSWWPAAWAAAMAAGLAAIVVGWSISSRYEERLETLAQETRALRDELAHQRSVLALI